MGTGIRLLREKVEEAMDGGATLRDVEYDVIRPADLSTELRDALWLYAWGISEREGERQPSPAAALPASE